MVRFHLNAPGDATVEVFDVAGRAVTAARLTNLHAGWSTYHFDARSADGRSLPNGVYHCIVRSGDAVRSDRMVLVR